MVRKGLGQVVCQRGVSFWIIDNPQTFGPRLGRRAGIEPASRSPKDGNRQQSARLRGQVFADGYLRVLPLDDRLQTARIR